jgi:CHAT domain-containing protein
MVSTEDDPVSVERNRLAKELYDILIKPVIDQTNPEKEICLIPDKILSQLPFASLLSPENKFLIEERKLFYAPSANVFLVFTKNAQRFGKNSNETILSIGNPAFDQEKFPHLENLEQAETEAKEIAKLYQKPEILLTKDAVKEKIKADLPSKDIIHFAGHYVVNEVSPMNSSFILADNQTDSANLANYELLGEDLSKTRLVVLSACRTNAESYYHGEGMMGASRTFLAAGIPLVVASQWSVETKATAQLMIKFHNYRKGGNLSTNSALRQAQLDLINGQDERYKNPYFWSAFITLGGYSEF